MSIESLKQQARKHEQNEEWQKALDQYNRALAELAREEQVDIGLHNRVGDLYVRVGDLDQAVEHYDKAVELYREAYLPNNAIAVCKKIIRNVPHRHHAFLLIGQIRAEQGFLPDARTNFLTYAERMAGDGDLDESFRALIEFCDLAPEEVGVRVMLAEQMAAQGRDAEAVEQLAVAHRHFAQVGDVDQAEDVKSRIVAIDPEADVDAMTAGLATAMPVGSMEDESEIGGDFGEIAIGDDAFDVGLESEFSTSMEAASEESSEDVGEADDDGGFGDFVIAGAEEAEGDAVADLPMLELGSSDDEDDGPADLPMLDFGSSEDEEGEGGDLPLLELGSSEDEEGEGGDLPLLDLDATTDVSEGFDLPTLEAEPADGDAEVELPALEIAPADGEGPLDLSVTTVEVSEETVPVPDDAAFGSSEPQARDEVSDSIATPTPELSEPLALDGGSAHDASEEIADVMHAAVEEASAESGAVDEPEESAATEDSASSDEGFVDFGAMILGGQEKKTTRFTVAYEEPSGDEQADFAKMLSQFKDKVSENLDSSDVRAHHDLGTAYKEMGLLDEAIASFQAALRASSEHLPTYELMGQTFLEMGQPAAAVKSLERAVEVATAVEDELVGIYYYLGLAYEQMENREMAVEYYERVFSLDINFADVTKRLRELR